MIAAAPARAEPFAGEVESPAGGYNLLRSLDELGGLLLETIAGSYWLDAFLLGAGMSQIVEDELHPDRLRLDETAKFLGASRAGRLVARVADGAQRAGQLFLNRDLLACERELAAIVDSLAAVVVGARAESSLLQRAAGLVEALERLPGSVRSSVLRLPACFFDFDQRPEDAIRLAQDFAARFPERERRLLVVGVRTSGSYLAPLQAACLRNEGFEHVEVLTARPGRRFMRAERASLRSLARDRGIALIVDDPPGTGGSLVRVIRSLGLPSESVVLLLQLFEGQELPPALASYASVCLPWSEWAVHDRLAPSTAATPLPRSDAVGRGHARALFGVGDGQVVLASGAGLGYLGSAASAVARALPDLLPEVLGAVDGVLWREWLPDVRRLEASAEAVAEYVAARAEALPVREDFSLRLAGEHPAWEIASNLLTRPFGRAAPAAKLLGVDAAVKRMLRLDKYSLVDGWMGSDQWFARDRPLKIGFYERSFWHLGLACFDPLHDLAGAAAGRDQHFVQALQGAYEGRSGAAVDPERFLLYELAHLWCRERLHPEEGPVVRRALAAAVRRYFASRFLDGQTAPAGPVCALDLDGVLETEHLGFPSTTRSGALALRALIRHGYRPVLASGRSAEEVADRCEGYGLPGGVAEYGGAIVVDGVVRSLLTDEMTASLERTREELAAIEGVHLDPLYRHSVRAYRIDGGRRRGLDRATIARVLAGAVQAIPGEGQTDFVPVGIDKATGLEALLAELGEPELAFAVGDTSADLPMLALAKHAAAPRHARFRGGRVRRPYQAGLALAVGGLLGHAPGSCPSCRPDLEPRTELLLTMLSAQERGPRGILGAALRLRRGAA